MSNNPNPTLNMVETFQCPGCVHGINTKCGQFKLNELAHPHDQSAPAPFRCRNHRAGSGVVGLRAAVNLGLPVPFARVQYREEIPGIEYVATNIRLHLYAQNYSTYWDDFNVPVWAMEKDGYLFVRTVNPRTDQMMVDVIKGGTLDLVREKFPHVIDVGPLENQMPL